MKNSIYLLAFFFICASLFVACESERASESDSLLVEQGQEEKDKPMVSEIGGERIISLSGFLTEVLYTMGYGNRIVGRDVTSTYPGAVEKVPSLGYITQLNAEAILGLKPDIIFLEKNQLKKTEVLNQLKDSGVEIISIPTSGTFHNSVKAAKILAKILEAPAESYRKIEEKIERDSILLAAELKKYDSKPSVLFIYARGTSRLMVGGSGTPAADMIEKAGGKNAITAFENYRELSSEALIQASPDVVLMFNSGLKMLDGREGVAHINGMQLTEAYKKNKIISMDGHYLTSFGPRSAEAALKLAKKIH